MLSLVQMYHLTFCTEFNYYKIVTYEIKDDFDMTVILVTLRLSCCLNFIWQSIVPEYEFYVFRNLKNTFFYVFLQWHVKKQKTLSNR